MKKQSPIKGERGNWRRISKIQKRDEEYFYGFCCERNSNVEICDQKLGGGVVEGEDQTSEVNQQEKPGIQRSTGGGEGGKWYTPTSVWLHLGRLRKGEREVDWTINMYLHVYLCKCLSSFLDKMFNV